MTQTDTNPSMLASFKTRAEAVAAKVYAATGPVEAARIIAEIATSKGQDQLAIAPAQQELSDGNWQSLLSELGKSLALVPAQSAGEIAAMLVGLSRADLGVAETGSLVFASN